MQTVPFSDDESAHITPKLSKVVLNSSSKAGSSVATPVNVSSLCFVLLLILVLYFLTYFFFSLSLQISSPEVAILGSVSLSQKLRSIGKKSDSFCNSKLNTSTSALPSSRITLSKTLGYPCQHPMSFLNVQVNLTSRNQILLLVVRSQFMVQGGLLCPVILCTVILRLKGLNSP